MTKKTLKIVFLFFLISSKLFACNCKNSNNLKEVQNREFKYSEYIFIGEILEIDSKKYTFKVKVIENFKGNNVGKVYSGKYDEVCGPIINEKGKWIIYAIKGSGNFIKINSCGITRSLKTPENNINATRQPKPPTANETKVQTQKKLNEFHLKAETDLKNEIIELRNRTK